MKKRLLIGMALLAIGSGLWAQEDAHPVVHPFAVVELFTSEG